MSQGELFLSEELLLHWLKAPEGTTLLNVEYRPGSKAISVIVDHEAFDVDQVGDLIPQLNVVIQQTEHDCGHSTFTASWPINHAKS